MKRVGGDAATRDAGGHPTAIFDPVLRIRHLFRLAGDFTSYAVVNRVWWILPLMMLLGLLVAFITVGQAAAPYTLYTLF